MPDGLEPKLCFKTWCCSESQRLTGETEFKEIRKEWKARKKEEETQRKAADERERAQAQANQVDGQSADPSQQGQAPNYPANVRPQLPPIGYAPADGQVPGQYAGQQPGMVYQQSNGQMGYPANYPHSPYAQGGQVYQQRKYLPRSDGFSPTMR